MPRRLLRHSLRAPRDAVRGVRLLAAFVDWRSLVIVVALGFVYAAVNGLP